MSFFKVKIGGFYSPPLMNYNSKKILVGPLISLTNRMINALGGFPVYKNLSQSQLNYFTKTNFDIGLAIFKTQQRQKSYAFSNPIMEISIQAVSKKKFGVFNSIEELALKNSIRLGVKIGDVGYWSLIESLGIDWVKRNVTLLSENSLKSSFSMLNNKCDAVLCDSLSLSILKKKFGGSYYLLFNEMIKTIDVCYINNTKSPINYIAINEWICNVKNWSYISSFQSSVENKLPKDVLFRWP